MSDFGTTLRPPLRWLPTLHERLIPALVDYYAPDGEHCGISFLDGTECEHPFAVVAQDLLAVSMLGLRVQPAAARRLLDETPACAELSACLMAVPSDVTLGESDANTLDAMLDLHHAVLALVDPRPAHAGAGEVVASAICARKRPELFPVLEPRFCRLLGLPGTTDPQASWKAVRDLVTQDEVARSIDAGYAAARTAAPGLRWDIYPLRRLQVAVELS